MLVGGGGGASRHGGFGGNDGAVIYKQVWYYHASTTIPIWIKSSGYWMRVERQLHHGTKVLLMEPINICRRSNYYVWRRRWRC